MFGLFKKEATMTKKLQPIAQHVTGLNINKALGLGGIAYIIYTTEGEFSRQNQPCYGELRKYESTHKGECTQPANAKPGDLRSPFPDGTPTALLVPFTRLKNKAACNADTDAILEAMFSKESPWYSGFNDVTFFKNEHGHLHGVVIDNVDLDATVMVNCFKQLQGMLALNVAKDFVDLCNEGLTPNEALAALMLNGSAVSMGIGYTDGYKSPTSFSAKRFFNRTPNDLTGGFFRDRIDYNRTDMHKPFYATGKGTVQWGAAAKEAGLPTLSYSVLDDKARTERLKTAVKGIKDIFNRALDNEPDPVLTPFEWKTTSGKTRGTPIALAR